MPPPSRILLATDLSARSDRALDRAVKLSKQWNAELVLLHVVEPPSDITMDLHDAPSWRRGGSPVEQAQRRVRRDLGELADAIHIVVEKGSPVEVIAEVARREECGLIVTGIARDETLGRRLLGATVERLVRTSPVPILVVKRRAGRNYRQFLVTTDFSDVSAHAIRLTAKLFPQAEMALLHAYDLPFVLADSRESFFNYLKQVEEREIGAFLDKTGLATADRQHLHVKIEHGDPVHLAAAYVADNDTDLTVVASHGHGALFEMFIGSTAYKLLQAVESDVLLVRLGDETK